MTSRILLHEAGAGGVREESVGLLPSALVSGAALVGAFALVTISVLEPRFLGVIRYPTSQSGIWQTEALDLANLVLVAPVLLAGACLSAYGSRLVDPSLPNPP